MRTFLFLLFAFLNTQAFAVEKTVTLRSEGAVLHGSLLIPDHKKNMPVALIIAGSGPTDRNGNNAYTHNNSLLFLAQALEKNGIASLRYDKRGVLPTKQPEEDVRFEHYISDAIGWIEYLSTDDTFSKVVVIGHSEGSLIGMMAARNSAASQFISLAAPAMSADQLIIEQLQQQQHPKALLKNVAVTLEKIKQGAVVETVHPDLYGLLRPSVQPYMTSWFQYSPVVELAKLTIPVLVAHGTTDIQVAPSSAQQLAEAGVKAKSVIILEMNHILKAAPLDRDENVQTYNQPELPIHPKLVTEIVDFI